MKNYNQPEPRLGNRCIYPKLSDFQAQQYQDVPYKKIQKKKTRKELLFGTFQASKASSVFFDDRIKRKIRQKQYDQRLNYKEKGPSKPKLIDYASIFAELCYGNSHDITSAAVLYNETLEYIRLYIKQTELQRDILYNKRRSNQRDKKEIKKQKRIKESKIQSGLVNSTLKPKEKEIQRIVQENEIFQPINKEEESKLTFSEYKYKKEKQQQKKMDLQRTQCEFTFVEDKIFQQQLIKFQRMSSLNNIISFIPYKSVVSLLIIQQLTFIIKKTSQSIILKYFKTDEKLANTYRELNSLAQKSKKYLIQEKLIKGMRYIDDVQIQMNKIYKKKNLIPKTYLVSSKISITHSETSQINQLGDSNLEQKKASPKSEKNTIVEEEKEIKQTKETKEIKQVKQAKDK